MDLTSAARIPLGARQDGPHAEAARMRAAGPVVAVELPGGVPAWLVTRHDVGMRVLSDPGFVKSPLAWGAWRRGEVPADWPLLPFLTVANMTTATGADHRRLRRPVARALTPARVEALAPHVDRIAHELLDEVAASGPDESFDLRARFAHPLPVRIVCELLGVPGEQVPLLGELCDQLFGAPAAPDEAPRVHRALRDALARLADHKRRFPADDLTTALVTLHDENGDEYGDGPGDGDDPATGRLTESELVDTLLLLIVAGHETTVNLLGNAVRALLAHPEQLALLRTGGAPWSSAVEETLRWDPPVANFPFRYAVYDVELAGTLVREGDPLVLSYISFGRDPEIYGEGADRFDVRRPVTRQLAFGHGLHYCVGATLARLEGQVALRALFTRFPRLAPDPAAPAPAPPPSLVFNPPGEIPVVRG
ncbi:cytochrome P450 [Streptomyces sp. NPDC001941]|uniref:cytochrome P450 family protein n=1 Tax=Streptomyces sp. NPDC001941 TaxID=3154659 RepID=UPI0033299728